jgi:molecular chaperone GrpE (heat shock protein)
MGETYVRERHEVLEHREAGQDWVGRVLQELRPGYLHEGRVIRRAQVVLGRPAM